MWRVCLFVRAHPIKSRLKCQQTSVHFIIDCKMQKAELLWLLLNLLQNITCLPRSKTHPALFAKNLTQAVYRSWSQWVFLLWLLGLWIPCFQIYWSPIHIYHLQWMVNNALVLTAGVSVCLFRGSPYHYNYAFRI